MKPILLICQHFFPYAPSLGRVIRAAALADFLKRKGFEVYVLTSKGIDFGYYGYEDLCNNLNIFYMDDRLKVLIQKKHRKKYYTSTNKGSSESKKFIDQLIKYAIESLFVPDTGVFMVKKYTKTAGDLIKRHNIKNVIISSPPHSMQLVGRTLKKSFKNDINFIVDYRDSWNTRPVYGKQFFVSDYISKKMERDVLSICDHFTYVSGPILNKIEDTYLLDIAPKATLIMNGFSRSVTPAANPATKKKDIIRIGYFGTANDLAKSRLSIYPLLEILKSNPDLQNKLEFHFYGALEFTNHSQQDFPCIQNNGSVSHDTALKKMNKMDFLLLLYSDPANSDEVITGKFFEYISRKKPIICLSPQNMEARRLIKKYDIGITIDIEDATDIETKLESLPALLNKNFYKNLNISQFKRENQYQKFLELLQ